MFFGAFNRAIHWLQIEPRDGKLSIGYVSEVCDVSVSGKPVRDAEMPSVFGRPSSMRVGL